MIEIELIFLRISDGHGIVSVNIKADWHLAFHESRSLRQDEDAVSKRDRFGQIMRDENCRFICLPDNLSDVCGDV